MNRTNFLATAAFFMATLVSGAAYAQQDPTLHEVYQAAQAGHLTEAQRMMDKVLADHPESAKAHFVEAEILARQGRNSEAQGELSTAERLQPGLSFESPQVVQDLKARIGGRGAMVAPGQRMAPVGMSSGGGVPWGMILVIGALIAFVVLVARAMGRRNTVVYGPNGQPVGFGPGMGPGMPGYGGGYGPGGYPMGGGGMGSGILGGLATGAAVGAGVVAGEELMHHFTDGNRGQGDYASTRDVQGLPPDNMGGRDFGVNDGQSWDDGGGSSGSWDTGSSDGGGSGGDWT